MSSVVTFILPVKNGAPHLAEALESLLAQSFTDWQCLVHDDGSTDDTWELIEGFASRDSRLIPSRSHAMLGVPKARQLLLERVTTPYVAIMDADDICRPDRLERQLAAAQADPAVTLWGSKVWALGEPTAGWLDYLEGLNKIGSSAEVMHQLFTDIPLAHPTWLGRTEILREVGGYREGEFAEDYDLLLRLVTAGHPISTVPEPLVGWRDHGARQTRTNPRYEADAMLRLKASHFPALYRDGTLKHLDGNAQRPLAVYGAGKTGRILAALLGNAGLAPRFFIDPMKAGERMGGLPVRGPEEVTPGAALILAAVRPVHLRAMVQERLEGLGHSFGRDWLWFY